MHQQSLSHWTCPLSPALFAFPPDLIFYRLGTLRLGKWGEKSSQTAAAAAPGLFFSKLMNRCVAQQTLSGKNLDWNSSLYINSCISNGKVLCLETFILTKIQLSAFQNLKSKLQNFGSKKSTKMEVFWLQIWPKWYILQFLRDCFGRNELFQDLEECTKINDFMIFT